MTVPTASPQLLPLRSFDEFTRLRSIVIGSPAKANHPEIDVSFQNFFQPPAKPELRRQAVGPVPQVVVDEIEEDIQGLVKVPRAHDVEVLRPWPFDAAVMATRDQRRDERLPRAPRAVIRPNHPTGQPPAAAQELSDSQASALSDNITLRVES